MKTRSIVTLVALIAFFGFVTYPLSQSVKAEQSKKQEIKKTITALDDSLKQVEKSKKDSGGQSIDLEKSFPADNEQEQIIKDLERISAISGFGFKNLSFSKGTNTSLGLPELKISFSTEGNRNNLQTFLDLIETNERFLGMETLSVQSNTNDNVSFGVSLYAFYRQQ